MVRARARRRRGVDTGAAWISYSDMMAALLLLFVLILCYSMYQYFLMLETKTAEIDEKAALLLEQEDTLLSQQGIILEQSKEIELKSAELSDKELSLATSNLELEKSQALVLAQESTLSEQAAALSLKEEELETANGLLLLRESQLSKAEEELEANKLELVKASEIMTLQQAALDTQQKKLDDLVGVKTRIITDLSQELNRAKLKATVDPTTGDIVLESTVFFDVGKNSIKDSGKKLLDTFIPVYLGVLLSPEYADYVGEIIIEGHTDTSGTYLMNLELSQDRALSVATYCLEMPGLTDQQRDHLRSILTAKGRSYANPILDANGAVDMDASRRVEFKFSLKDAEMIEEIRTILDQDFGMEMPVDLLKEEPNGEE